jgi:VanZ family protein
MKLISFLAAFYRTLIICVVILIVSLLPGDEVNKLNWFDLAGIDKIVHSGMYFILTLIMMYESFKYRSIKNKSKFYLFSGLTVCSYSAAIELIQLLFTDSRKAEIADLFFNILGILVSILVWNFVKSTK